MIRLIKEEKILVEFEEVINKMIAETTPFPARFKQMIQESSILEACQALLESNKISDGFTSMILKNRMDLTVEYVVANNEEFQKLFTEKQINHAKERIQNNK